MEVDGHEDLHGVTRPHRQTHVSTVDPAPRSETFSLPRRDEVPDDAGPQRRAALEVREPLWHAHPGDGVALVKRGGGYATFTPVDHDTGQSRASM